MRGGLNLEHLITLATVYALVWATGACMSLFTSGREHRRRAAAFAGASLVALAWVVWFSGTALPGHNSVVQVLGSLRSANPHHLCAAALGGALGVWASLWSCGSHCGRWGRLAGHACVLASFVLLGVVAMEEPIALRWTKRSVASVVLNPAGTSAAAGFVLDEYHASKYPPVQIAMGPGGKLYYCHLQNAGVSRVDIDPATGRSTETQVASNLKRVHGLAFHNGDLYVSRSGTHSRAQFGKMKDAKTGAVTLLRDLDGDGVMDYYHDVIEGLPGAQMPDEVHQNNGIVFGPDGSLFVTVGSNANKAAVIDEHEGTILKARADGSALRVFA
ncbi:MAG: hypothetical protein ACRD44_11735, partial [Bryobacteraceae bacterium]